jgi:transposase-like protein
MKTPKEQVAAALAMYYEGESLNGIRRNLQQIYGNYPSDSTVYEWIDRFSRIAVNEAKQYKPKVGDTWVADETVLKVGGQNVWFWDVMDVDTRFLLASHISKTRTITDARVLMAEAARRAEKPPKVVVTDQLAAYIDGIELNFGSDTKHIAAKSLTSEDEKQLIERFHGTLKDRTKVMRGMKTIEGARKLTDGWLVHYNYFRPHEGLDGRIPAETAGIQFPFKNWVDVVESRSKVIVTDRAPIAMLKTATMVKRKSPSLYPRRPCITSQSSRITEPRPRLGKVHFTKRGMGITRRTDR